MRYGVAILCIIAVMIALPDVTLAIWGGTGSEVVDITLHKDVKRIKKSPYAWAVALYRDGCGYCELLRPEWSAAAMKMRKMAGVAAVDVVNHQHIAQSLMKEYGFEVKGVPTVIMLKPMPDGKKELIQYSGERKAKAIVRALTDAMPQFVARMTAAAYQMWQRKPGAKILLFTKKHEPPPQLKALSTKYRDRNVSFAIVDPSESGLRSLFSINDFPTLVAVESNRQVGKDGYKPILYTRGNSFVSMDFWVMDFAATKTADGTESDPKDGNGGSGPQVDASRKKMRSKKSKTNAPTSASKKSKTTKQAPSTAGSSKKKSSASNKRVNKMDKSKRSPTLNGKLRRLQQPAKPIRLKGANLKELSVKDLRGILARWDDACSSCLEKSNFIERIERHRKTHGDMEHIAEHYAKKHQRQASRRKNRSPAADKKEKESSDPGSSKGVDSAGNEDDPFCTRMLAMEKEPLLAKIDKLEAENSQLRMQLDQVSAPLIHEDL